MYLQHLEAVAAGRAVHRDFEPQHDKGIEFPFVPAKLEHHYRLFTIWLLPQLNVLDCQKVKLSERTAAHDLLGKDYDNRSPAADALLGSEAEVANVAEPKSAKTLKMLTPEEKAKLVVQLEQASSIKDIERISKMLKQGITTTTSED